VDLCRELGLAGDGDGLFHPALRGAFVWARGRLVPYPRSAVFGVPAELEELLRWPGLSRSGRLQAFLDLYRRRRNVAGDQSMGELVTRRMGRECAEVLVGPLLAGVNAADPDRLSVEATFPELARWEERHGSLIRGARAARRPEVRDDGPLFATVAGGLARLVEALVAGIERRGGRVRPAAPVRSIDRTGDGLRVAIGDASDRLAADAVVLATPAFESARLLLASNDAAAAELAAIPYVSTAVVALSYPAGTADRLPAASGFIVPAVGRAGAVDPVITACTWISRKWPDAAFGDRAVLRVFVGRAGGEEALGRSDPELVAAVVRDIEAVAPVGEMPEAAAVRRWERAMPQYEVGHLDRVARVESALASTPGVFVTGSAYRGAGIADCVRQANDTAAAVRRRLAATRGEPGAASPVTLDRQVEAR